MPSQTLTPAEARTHVGETATVCGKFASAHHAPRARAAHFHQSRQALSRFALYRPDLGSDRQKFGAPETAYQDRDISVTGQVKQYGMRRRSSPLTPTKSRFDAGRVNDVSK